MKAKRAWYQLHTVHVTAEGSPRSLGPNSTCWCQRADVSTAGAILCGGLVLHAGSRAVLHRALVAATLLLSLPTAAFWLGALR